MLATISEFNLRKAQLLDIDYFINLERLPENRTFIIPWSLSQYEKALHEPDKLLIILENNQAEKIGFIILAGLSSPHHSVELVRIIIDEKGKGYGKLALAWLIQYAFTHLNAHRLWLDVKDYNQRGIHIYERAGFKVEGKLRDSLYINGNYESLYIMSILQNEYDKN